MYQTELEYTYGEYMKMQRLIYKRKFLGILIVITIGIVVGIDAIECILLGILAILIFLVISAIQIRNGWKLDKKTDTIVNQYTFLLS